jgi:uncharacterized protein (TIGR03083 family)
VERGREQVSLDHHLSIIEADANRILVAYAFQPDGRIPWSDRWTVRTVARHLARAHHLVAGIIHGRPTADFALVEEIELPPKDDPGFPAWSRAGTSALCDALRSTDLDEPCWTSVPAGAGVRFWLTRMTAETLVHRWDAEVGAGLAPAPFDVAAAVDGVREYVTLAMPALRTVRRSPAGPALRVRCTDADGSWFVRLTDNGGSTVGTDAVPVSATLEGRAEDLLLVLMGRLSLDEAGIEVDGDRTIFDGRDELLPRA